MDDLSDRVTSVERKQSAAVQQVPDARSDSRSVRQPVSLGVSDHIDMYHTHVGMGEFPRPVLHSTMRKVAEGPPISVSTHFTPISSMLDLGSGLGAHIHSGTPAAAVDVSRGAFGSVSNGVYRPFLPAGVAPALGVAEPNRYTGLLMTVLKIVMLLLEISLMHCMVTLMREVLLQLNYSISNNVLTKI